MTLPSLEPRNSRAYSLICTALMNGRFCQVMRDLHLHLGLFVSPFIVVFAVSVFFLVHTWLPKAESGAKRVVADPALPANLEELSGRPLINALQPVLASINAQGEVGWVQHRAKERRLIRFGPSRSRRSAGEAFAGRPMRCGNDIRTGRSRHKRRA